MRDDVRTSRRRRRRGQPLRGLVVVGGILIAAGALTAEAPGASPGVIGSLWQPAGVAGCVAAPPLEGCATAPALLTYPRNVAVSPDGANVYVLSFSERQAEIGVLTRTGPTAPLAQPEAPGACVLERAPRGPCLALNAGCRGPNAHMDFRCRIGPVLVSPDGRDLELAVNGGIEVFARSPADGTLQPVGVFAACLGGTPATGDCHVPQPRRSDFLDYGLTGAQSPDGRNVYFLDRGAHALVVFQRDPGTGRLTQLAGTSGCLTDRRRRGCTQLGALYAPEDIVVAPDGAEVYLLHLDGDTSEGVEDLHRDPSTGRLTRGPNLAPPGFLFFLDYGALATAPSADDIYVALGSTAGPESIEDGEVLALRRTPTTGAVNLLGGRDGCLKWKGSNGDRRCRRARFLAEASGMVVSPDGANAYVAVGNGVDLLSFARDPTSGALHQLPGQEGCATSARHARRCLQLHPTVRDRCNAFAYTPSMSPDGLNVYVPAYRSVEVLVRNVGPAAPDLRRMREPLSC